MKFDLTSKPFSATIAAFGSIASAGLVSTKPPTVWHQSEEEWIDCALHVPLRRQTQVTRSPLLRAQEPTWPKSDLLCSFYVSQVQELGLAVAYNNDNAIHRYVKVLMALPYLPHQEIPASFQWLRLQATTPVLHELVDYVNNQWINTNTFPPSSWSVYGQPVRTNNDIEGWHNSLDRRAGERVHLPFYLLIQLLHRESSVCTVQLRLVNARKLQRIQCKKYCALQARIFGYWKDYAGSKIFK
ncbi:uncharacterized protein LOC114951799 [Acropora millepora]|uniref:uncharacterized protein LOC114951799 n=1 Tax=Acropora millepora TaxID=45264 RepID=UPI001CF5E696|nr:uncharacterized protein LOC114951799 [Acropora millepora]